MTNFLSKIGITLLVMVSVNTAFAGASDPAQPEKQLINIGIYAPFTTKSAVIGRHMLGAMEIARDQLKSSEIHYEFFTLDQIPDKAQAAHTLQKFINVHHINVLLTEGADTGAVVATIAQKNNLIHFNLGSEALIADGKNNFQTHTANHAAMKPEFVEQFKQEYFSHPITQAGYAYDIFHLLNNSAVIAMKSNANFSSQAIATHLLALESGTGLMRKNTA